MWGIKRPVEGCVFPGVEIEKGSRRIDGEPPLRKRYNRYALSGSAVYFFMLKMGIAKVTASRTVVTTPVITWISANKSALVTKVSPPFRSGLGGNILSQ